MVKFLEFNLLDRLWLDRLWHIHVNGDNVLCFLLNLFDFLQDFNFNCVLLPELVSVSSRWQKRLRLLSCERQFGLRLFFSFILFVSQVQQTNIDNQIENAHHKYEYMIHVKEKLIQECNFNTFHCAIQHPEHIVAVPGLRCLPFEFLHNEETRFVPRNNLEYVEPRIIVIIALVDESRGFRVTRGEVIDWNHDKIHRAH